MVFDKYLVKRFEPYCRPPQFIGEVYADADEGEDALKNLRFSEDKQGLLHIWAKPEVFDDVEVTDRYLTVVDIGGRSNKADWSVIVVFDRLSMIDGSEPPSVVAQWYGHCDIDRLAWRAAQIAAYYNESLLVIESNTLRHTTRNGRWRAATSRSIFSTKFPTSTLTCMHAASRRRKSERGRHASMDSTQMWLPNR